MGLVELAFCKPDRSMSGRGRTATLNSLVRKEGYQTVDSVDLTSI